MLGHPRTYLRGVQQPRGLALQPAVDLPEQRPQLLVVPLVASDRWLLERDRRVLRKRAPDRIGVERRREEDLRRQRQQEVDHLAIEVRAVLFDLGRVEVERKGGDFTAAAVLEDVRLDRVRRVEVSLQLGLEPLDRHLTAQPSRQLVA